MNVLIEFDKKKSSTIGISIDKFNKSIDWKDEWFDKYTEGENWYYVNGSVHFMFVWQYLRRFKGATG